MNPRELIEAIVRGRRELVAGLPDRPAKQVAEGGCGVVGYMSTRPFSGGYIHRPLTQMHNRGNGKGGGIAAIGCFPDRRESYAIQMGYLADSVATDEEIRKERLEPVYQILDREVQPSVGDPREVGLEIAPPKVVRYFCRVRPEVREAFATESGIADRGAAESELVYRTSFGINETYYATDEPRALVLSHARDLAIYKGVGYAEQVLKFYRLDEVEAHGWIGHQRYPTRGRVWHPGGAHPFIGLDEALVHNGDFANYHAVAEYLSQHGTRPLFVTDTEVAVLLFDLLTRVYGYSLEHAIEALAPTSQLDFLRLPKRKQRVYRALHASHLHGSPDGPWFFIIARNPGGRGVLELVGITDTSMLRPQVFALHRGGVSVGAVASEKQAIDALLEDLARDHEDVCPVADRYWNARGGSHTDGGSFVFRIRRTPDGPQLDCVDKFGQPVHVTGQVPPARSVEPVQLTTVLERSVTSLGTKGQASETLGALAERLRYCTLHQLDVLGHRLVGAAAGSDGRRAEALELLTLLRDRHYDPGSIRRAELLAMWDGRIRELLGAVPAIDEPAGSAWRRVDSLSRARLRGPESGEAYLVVDAGDFPPEGRQSVARLLVAAADLGWRRFYVFRTSGDRFIGSGLGVDSRGIRIDVYGSPGDYLGSSLDGAEIHVHADAQDQVGQIMKSGLLVIHGSVGQTLLYGAKGGQVFIKGNAGGRALINAVGRIQAVINGTCLDYAAESFMAGRPTGDGFLVINGLEFDERGNVIGLELKYPGSTFFSLASGGAGYINDPYRTVGASQLNGAEFCAFSEEDWQHIYPALRENETFFGISVEQDLQTVDGVFHWPRDIFRKVVAVTAA